jgi:alkylation response protein AidB-like acyl-CoA dehydrogenase
VQLDFTSDQDELRSSIRQVLDKECPPPLVRAHVDHIVRGEDSDAGLALWSTFAGLDWPALTVPEAHGGIGLGVIELAIEAEELGRALAFGPLVPTVAAFVPAVREAAMDAAQAARWLSPIAAGELTGTLAVAEGASAWSSDDVGATVTPDGDGYVLAGTKRWVILEGATEIVCAVRTPGTVGTDGISLVVVPAGSTTIELVRSLDATRLVGHVNLDGVHIDADRVLGEPGRGAAALQRAVEEATVAASLELVGTCQAIFDTNLRYAKERHQFGVPIGSFQAVKHKLANMFVAIERARATALFAAATIEEDDPRRTIAASMAKAAAGEAQRLVAQDGIQLLGGIGYTWEHDQQLWVKRAKAAEPLFGSAAWHRQRIASLLGL